VEEDPARNRLRTMLGDLVDHMEGAQDVASRIARWPLFWIFSWTQMPQ